MYIICGWFVGSGRVNKIVLLDWIGGLVLFFLIILRILFVLVFLEVLLVFYWLLDGLFDIVLVCGMILLG